MKRLGCFKDFKIRPLDGGFDARSPSGELNFYDFRVVLNMDLTDQRKRARMGGWQKLMADSPFGFKNQDLHDQLFDCDQYYESISQTVTQGGTIVDYQYPFWYPAVEFPEYSIGYEYYGGYTIPGYGAGDPTPVYLGPYSYEATSCGDYVYRRGYRCREAITLLYEAVAVSGRRKLIAGTKSRLYVLNERSGNWRILADGQGGPYQADDNCGCSQRRFKVAQVGNILIITNNFDPVMTWEIDAGAGGCDLWSTEYITDLQGLGITKAGVVAAWQGFAFIADVQVDNERHASRIYWSDLNDPRTWAPGGGTAAGFVDLGLGERVVAISPIGGQLRVYTSRGNEKAIYDVTIVGGDAILNFNEIYRGPDGIEYPNSLVTTGGTHVWFSTSGIMVLGEYDRTPQRLEWIYKADSVFYDGLPSEWLRDFDGLAGFGGVNKEQCDNVVGGFNSEKKQIWFSWPTDDNECANMSLVLNPVYRVATLVDHGFTAFANYRPDHVSTLRDFLAEFGGCDPADVIMPKEGEPMPGEAFEDPPAYIRNYGEYPDLPADPDSVCARLAGMTLEDLCESCGVDSVFVMADAHDKTLKQFEPGQYFRERYIDQELVYDCPATVPGVYATDGYYSMLQSDAADFGTKVEKLINKMLISFNAEVQTTPNLLYANVGYGSQAECLSWDKSAPAKPLECLTQKTRNQHKLRNTRADEIPSFPFYRRGTYLAWRFFSNGTGGGAEYAGINLSVKGAASDWK